MSPFTEQNTVEDYIVRRLTEAGWKFIPATELERDTYEEPLLERTLLRAIERINSGLDLEEEEIRKAANELKLAGTGIEGSKRILRYFKEGVPVKIESKREVRYLDLFDYENVNNNEYTVSRQVIYHGREKIRTDVMLYVNGIPLVNIECKNPAALSENWYNAYRQIKDYEKNVPELYKYVQIGVAAEQEARFFPVVPWQDDVRVDEWKENGGDPVDNQIAMLRPDVLLDIIRNFLFVRVERGEATKVIGRYIQYRAANKMVNRVLNKLDGKEDKNKGLIWHWQGSGKTLTMIFAAHKLYFSRRLENPTVFFIVDRIDLEDQLYKEFGALDIVKPGVIGSVDELQDMIRHDGYRGKRGLFITLIHKFRPKELDDIRNKVMQLSEQNETIATRMNVLSFIDESHRTQYGTLAASMKAILRSGFFFALTGTPISKLGRDTYREFSYPPDEPYLDRYFITDSIRDGFTLKIVYQPRLEKDWHLKRELLETFLDTELEDLEDEQREYVEKRINEKLNAITLFLENPNRIKTIAEDIAKHFMENVDGKFKAMVVAGSRKGCELYKRELDKHLPPEYSEVVMSYRPDHEEEKIIRQAVAERLSKYHVKDLGTMHEKAIGQFKEGEHPKILIVTEMLLAGFDAPVLQTMYLDKPLKEHRLLQAIARTNRPYKDLKEAGLIVDYVGILKHIRKALKHYSENEISGVLDEYDSIRGDFELTLNKILALFEGLTKEYGRDVLRQALEIITSDEQTEKDFTESYRRMRRLFELLGPDEIKVERFEEYKWLSSVYTYYMKQVNRQPAMNVNVERYFDKTVRFIHKSTELQSIEDDLPVIQFDERYLDKLEQRIQSKEEKAANILFTLNRLVLVDRHQNPVYESLIERVERLLELWKEKTKDYGRIYSEGIEIIKRINSLSERQRSLGYSDFEYAVLLLLEDRLQDTDGLVESISSLFENVQQYLFPGWNLQTTAKKNVERELRKFVLKLKQQYSLSYEEIDEIHEKIVKSIEHYAV